MSISNIVNGFRATGICPYDKDILPIEAFAPSLPTERPILNNGLKLSVNTLDSEYDSDDYLPLSEVQRKIVKAQENSFSEVLPTPDLTE